MTVGRAQRVVPGVLRGRSMRETALVTLGYVLARIPLGRDRGKGLKGHLCAIRAELEPFREGAGPYLEDRVVSPLCRMPLTTYQASAPILALSRTSQKRPQRGAVGAHREFRSSPCPGSG